MTMVSFVFAFMTTLSAFAQPANDLASRCVDITFDQKEGVEARKLKAELDAINIPSEVRRYLTQRWESNGWYSMKIPHLAIRTVGTYQAINNAFSMYGIAKELGSEPDDWLKSAREFFSESGVERARTLKPANGVLGTPLTPTQLRARMLRRREYDESSLGSIWKKFPILPEVGCAAIDPGRVVPCAAAVRYAYKNLYLRGNSFNLGTGWLVDILTSNRAEKDAFKLVNLMLGRIQSGNFAHASLIEDAYTSFEDKRMAEDFLLLSLVHGQISIDSYSWANFIQPYNFNVIVAAYMTSMLSATLDSLVLSQSPEKRIYVSPLNATNVCDNGKAYHFLVPWYIARRLSALGYPKEVSAKVPFFFDWVYQVFSKSLGRDPLANVHDVYDSGRNQGHRLDLVFSAMGANLGADRSKPDHSVDFTAAFDSTQSAVDQDVRESQTGELTFQKIFYIGTKRFNLGGFLDVTQ